jgi:ubiquinone/menaquinone biosynthesis C-methylase UbiE/uncharacterized protein YbaR (Trm112 family)
MHYALLDILACPIDMHYPMEIHVLEQKRVSLQNGTRCKQYCAQKKEGLNQNFKSINAFCSLCDEIEIEIGIIRCPQCNHWFPIEDGIVTFLPDELRQSSDERFFKTTQHLLQRHPILSEIKKPTFFSHVKTNTKEIEDKKREIEIRDDEARIYDTFFSNEYELIGEIPPVLNKLQLKSESKILDLGAGTGRLTTRLLPLVKEIVAVDFSRTSLEECRKKCEQYIEHKPIHFIHADIEYLPFVSRPIFNHILSAQVFSHLPNSSVKEKGYKKIASILKPKGKFVFTVYNYNRLLQKRGYPQQLYGNSGIYIYQFTEEELRQELLKYFKTVNLTGILNFRHIGTRLSLKLGKHTRPLDWFIEKTPIAKYISSLWLVKCTL